MPNNNSQWDDKVISPAVCHGQGQQEHEAAGHSASPVEAERGKECSWSRNLRTYPKHPFCSMLVTKYSNTQAFGGHFMCTAHPGYVADVLST